MLPSGISDFLYERILSAPEQNSAGQEMREYRMVLDGLFRTLTKEDGRTFSNLYARTQFVFDKQQVPNHIQEQITGLRIFSNRVIAGTLPTQEELLLARAVAANAVLFFSGEELPPALKNIVETLPQKKWNQPKGKRIAEEMRPIKAVVQELKATGMVCREQGEGLFFLEIPPSEKNDLRYLLNIVQPYDTIRIIGAGRAEGSEENYTTLSETQIVLEPDLLMDISELAECFTPAGFFPLNFLVKKLVPPFFSEAALKGNMVNAIFDAAIRADKTNFMDVFKEAVADQVFQAASFGKETLNTIYKDIVQHHWINLSAVAGELRKKPVRIEPSFFSAHYGIQGRLDVMVEDAQDENRKEIIELKSGRPPERDTWVNHGMQVIGYNMLLKSAFGNERRGSSAILYSAAPDAPLRNVTSNLLMENRLLQVRNFVVAWLMQLAAENYSCLAAITPLKAVGLPAFTRRDYEFFHGTYTQAGDKQKAYYQAYLSFIMREYLQSKSGMYSAPEREDGTNGFAALWLHAEEEKIQSFSIIRGLRFAELLNTSYYVRFEIKEPQHHNFRAGDTVLMYPRRNGMLEPQQQQVVKGRIDKITPQELVLSLNNHQLDASYFSDQEDWVLEHDVYESNYWLSTRALFQVLRPENEHRFRLLLGETAPRISSAITIEETGLNGNQRQILHDTLAAQDYYLLQGPPGTGKTSTMLTRMVKQLYAEGKTTVIVAFTNRAVEEIAERLSRNAIPFMRLGSRKSESEQQLRDFCREGKIEKAIALVQKHQVFLSTVATMAARIDQWKLFGKEADTLIVDEASQLTEPQLLPLAMAFRKFILIGDQNQLPPVVAQDAVFCQTKSDEMQQAGITDLRCSLFERLMKKSRASRCFHAYGMLTTHFRMHQDIASLINHYYANELKCGQPSQLEPGESTPLNGSFWRDVLAAGRAIFIPSPTETTSRFHRTEAARVVSLLKYLTELHGDKFFPETVGVVTPWRTQIGLIQSLLPPDEIFRTIPIDTVERFQGGENDVIIVSMALYHPGQLNILHSPGIFQPSSGQVFSPIEVDRKLLVTLSRARKQIIFLGDENVLLHSKHYAAVLQKMKRVELR